MTSGQHIVHKLKYNNGDCVGESLRALFPDFHSKHCDDAVEELIADVVKFVVPKVTDKVVDIMERPRLYWIDDPMREE